MKTKVYALIAASVLALSTLAYAGAKNANCCPGNCGPNCPPSCCPGGHK